jgi:hypothetical protein
MEVVPIGDDYIARIDRIWLFGNNTFRYLALESLGGRIKEIRGHRPLMTVTA